MTKTGHWSFIIAGIQVVKREQLHAQKLGAERIGPDFAVRCNVQVSSKLCVYCMYLSIEVDFVDFEVIETIVTSDRSL